MARPRRQPLRLFTAAHGTSHPLTAGVLAPVGACLAATGHPCEAIAAREEVLSNYLAKGVAPILLAESKKNAPGSSQPHAPESSSREP